MRAIVGDVRRLLLLEIQSIQEFHGRSQAREVQVRLQDPIFVVRLSPMSNE